MIYKLIFYLLYGTLVINYIKNLQVIKLNILQIKKSHNKALHADPKSYAPFVALRYNATKGTKLFGLVNKALCPIKGEIMKVSGKFDANLNPLDFYAQGEIGINFGRMSIDKTFHGELDATSKGEMLSAMTSVEGSAGYVAIEQVTGSLSDKKGSFVLQHFGTMDKGKDHLILEVVPDSGSDELSGLVGKMEIKIEEGQHYYEFEYDLA